MDYKSLLKDQRWKVLSNKVKERDGYKCILCDDADKLQVHHKRYVGKYPWDSPMEDLITLCSSCHNRHHKVINKQERNKAVKLLDSGTQINTACSLLKNIGYKEGVDFWRNKKKVIKFKRQIKNNTIVYLEYYPEIGSFKIKNGDKTKWLKRSIGEVKYLYKR